MADNHPFNILADNFQIVKERCLSMLALLEKALPIIEREAIRRDEALEEERIGLRSYWTEMRELADEISAEIDKAYGRESSKSDPELCPHGYGFVEYCEDCKGKEVKHGE